jgi:hypothetical protein
MLLLGLLPGGIAPLGTGASAIDPDIARLVGKEDAAPWL